MPVSIRSSTVGDAPRIAELAAEFAGYLRSLGDPEPGQISEAQYATDAAGPRPALEGLIGELDGQVAGYLLYCHAYDLDLGGRVVWVIDLFVREAARGRGMGRALMQAAAEIGRESGARHLSWSVYTRNELGRRFYERLGARYAQDLRFMHWRVPESRRRGRRS